MVHVGRHHARGARLQSSGPRLWVGAPVTQRGELGARPAPVFASTRQGDGARWVWRHWVMLDDGQAKKPLVLAVGGEQRPGVAEGGKSPEEERAVGMLLEQRRSRHG